MQEIIDIVMAANGPVPHALLFGSVAAIIGWFTKEVRATMLLMVVLSVGAECLQLAWPHIYQFEYNDIMWNIIGSVCGIAFAQVGLLIVSDLWVRRNKGLSVIKREVTRGNNPG